MSESPPPASSARPGRGYALVALIVIVAVMNVLVAASLPYWSQIIKRDKEAELIFRGLQYAEAIRVFQLRFQMDQKLDRLAAVYDPVIVSQREVHHRPRLNLAVDDHRPLLNLVHAKDTALRRIQYRR